MTNKYHTSHLILGIYIIFVNHSSSIYSRKPFSNQYGDLGVMTRSRNWGSFRAKNMARVDKNHEFADYYHLSSNFTRKAVNAFEKLRGQK